jgi:hypothetical protein
MRTVAVLALLLAVALVYTAMWRGWRARAARQADLPALPAPPVATSSVLPDGPVEASYVGTSAAGVWLDRMVAQGLGRRGNAVVDVTTDGVLIERAAPDSALWLPRGALREVRRDRGVAGKATFEAEGLLVLTWAHGDRVLDSGLRLRHAADAPVVQDAVQSLLTSGERS